MNENLRLSPAGENLIKAFESCLQPDKAKPGHYRPYICPAGVLTIGWGHTNQAGGRWFNRGTRWTKAECDNVFLEDMQGPESTVRRLAKVRLAQNQFDALVSFVFNCGETNFAKSTLLRKLNRGDFEGAAREFTKWTRGGGRVLPGLVRRRASEALLFQGIPDADYDGQPDGLKRKHVAEYDAEPMPQQIDEPEPPKSMATSKTGGAAVAVGLASVGEAGQQVNQAAEQIAALKGHAETLGLADMLVHLLTNPVFLIAFAAAALCAFIWFDRRRKLREEQV